MFLRYQVGGVVRLTLVLVLLGWAGGALAFISPERSADSSVPMRELDLHGYRTPQVASASSLAAQGFANRTGGEWKVYSWNPQTGTPHALIGSGVPVTGSLAGDAGADVAAAAARQVIAANPEIFRADLANLRLTATPEGRGKRSVLFQQTYHGLDVWGGEVRLTFTEQGRLFHLGSDCYPDIRVSPQPSLTAGMARELARQALPIFDPARDTVEEEATLLVLPVPLSETSVEHHLAWRVRVRTEEPVGIWTTFVDAHSGAILWRYNEVKFLNYTGTTSGMVQRPSYCEGQSEQALPYLRIQIAGLGTTYADVNGNWNLNYAGSDPRAVTCDLYSPYVDLYNTAGQQALFTGTATPGTPLTVSFSDANAQKDERDVYTAINDIHTFYQVVDPNFGYQLMRIMAYVSINSSCNAYWNGSINFYRESGGCANTGEIMGVVQHEYGHGITNWILGSQGSQGIGEGNSDVIANLMTLESIIGRGFTLNDCANGIRNSENTLRYPENVIGVEEHSAGQVIAGFHWDAQQSLMAQYGTIPGRDLAANLWHWGRILEHPTTQPDQVLATFIADDDDGDLTNGTPHYDALSWAAFNHGFDSPELQVGVFIAHEPASSRTQSGDVPIVAQITSTDGALVPDSTLVRYRINGGAFVTVTMQPTGSPDEYSAVIPGVEALDEVDYYIRSRDADGHTRTAPLFAPVNVFPFSVATQYFDMEAAAGWTVNQDGGDNATQGAWVRVNPVGTFLSGQPVQTEDDRTHSPGTVCWVTGNGLPGGSPYDSDVSGGKTTLFSPIFDLTGAERAEIKYWRWYTNNLGENPEADNWRVQVSNNGGGWVILEYTGRSANSWTNKSYDLKSIFGSAIGQVQIRFVASDLAANSLIEAAVDDFELLASFPADAPAGNTTPNSFAFAGSRPNPVRGAADLEFALPSRSDVRLSVYDVSGRLLRVVADGAYEAGVHHVRWDAKDGQGREVGTGMYFCRMTAGGFQATRTLVVAR